jgi:hypothetical protein
MHCASMKHETVRISVVIAPIVKEVFPACLSKNMTRMVFTTACISQARTLFVHEGSLLYLSKFYQCVDPILLAGVERGVQQ